MTTHRARGFLRRLANGDAGLASLIAVSAILFTLSATAQSDFPRFERGDCLIPQPEGSRLDCGYVIAAESPERPNGQTVRLAVAIFRPPQPATASPIVMLRGGPGFNALRSPLSQKAAAWSIAFGRDVVVYDQRGSGLSEPALCPDVVRESFARPAEELAGECLTSLEMAGVDPTAYTTDGNVADAIDVRRALGYRSWIVYGESYGSRLALELARRDAAATSGLVLTSPLPPGPRFYAELPLNFRRALHRVFAGCAKQQDCSDAFPTLETDFYALYDQLTAQPLTVAVEGSTIVQFDGRRFVQGMRAQFGSEALLVRVPRLINELRRGSRESAARAIVDLGQRLSPATYLVVMQDVCGPALTSAIEAANANLGGPFRWDVAMVKNCDVWRTRVVPPFSPSPLPSGRSDVPTLIFAAEFDDRTPVEYGREIAKGFRSSRVYEIPGRTHAWSLGTCEDAMVRQFLAHPRGRLDASCIAKEPGMMFESRALELQRLVLAISDEDPASSVAGTWEAWVPGPQIVNTLELRISGDSITGRIVQPRNTAPISEGHFESGTMQFKATATTGDRTIGLRGTVSGDEIHFVRDFAVRPGGDPGGEGIFGIRGPQTFIARRRN